MEQTLRRDGILSERIEMGERPAVHGLHMSTSPPQVIHYHLYSPELLSYLAL